MKPFNPSGAFERFPEGGGKLRQLAVRGAGVTLLSSGMGLGIQVISTVVLARLLTPKDFGLVTMVTTFSLLLANFGFNGLTEAIIQREEMDHALASTLFWINLAVGLVLTAAFAASGTLLARFYHDPPVRQVAIGVSLTIFLTSVSVVHLALLKRAMHFTRVSLNDVGARFISVVVSILLALAGWGYWALVAGTIALPLTISGGAFLLCRWMPGLPRRVGGTASTLKFALHTYGNFTVNYFSRNTDNLLVGWRFDARSLGFYKKAYDLFALSAGQLVSSIAVVVVAALSRLTRDIAQYKRYLLSAITVIAFVGMGLGAALTLTGTDVIRILLGPGWEPAGHIFTYFGPGIGVMVLYHTHGWIHLSIGRADRWFRWALVEFAVTVLLFIVALPWGPVGIAVAWTASFWLLTIPAMWYAGRPIGLGVKEVLAAVWRYGAASLLAGGLTYVLLGAIPFLATAPDLRGAMLRLASTLTVFTSLYLSAVVILHGGFRPVYQIVSLIREMIPMAKVAVVPVETSWEHAPDSAVEGDSGSIAPVGSAGDNLPLVSILIPAYNAEAWIAGTIKSALSQSWPRTEIIVVDDGSTDQTVARAREFEVQGVRVVEQKNQGASAARNKAFSVSSGDYIQWLDADDLLAPDKIARQMEFVHRGVRPRTLLSSPWGHFMYQPTRARFVPSGLWCDLTPVEWLLRKMDQNVYMQTASWLVSRELTEAAGPWDIRLLGDDDGEYFCRVLLASEGVRFVPGAKVYYRAFQFNSLSYIGRFPQKIDAHWLSMKLHIQYLRSLEDSPRVAGACLQYLRDSLIYFYPDSGRIVREMEEMARELGEELGAPYLSWKYVWIERLFGWTATKHIQQLARKLRWSTKRSVDKILLGIQSAEARPFPEDAAPSGDGVFSALSGSWPVPSTQGLGTGTTPSGVKMQSAKGPGPERS
jgi:O-antigen/teichoic acid export membrane protein/glycosyltransferase involved in cell wall biosynthesis